jgi:hypothetical protein
MKSNVSDDAMFSAVMTSVFVVGVVVCVVSVVGIVLQYMGVI